MNNKKLSPDKKGEIKNACKTVKLMDFFLIVILLLLIFQSVYSLFFNDPSDNGPMSRIDLIFRTSLTSIYGYILSANFLSSQSVTPNKNNIKGSQPPKKLVSNTNSNVITNKIGFTTGTVENIEANAPIIEDVDTIPCTCGFNSEQIQIFIVGSLGVLALVILIIVRNINIERSYSEAILGQLINMVSAATGFLIGIPTKK